MCRSHLLFHWIRHMQVCHILGFLLWCHYPKCTVAYEQTPPFREWWLQSWTILLLLCDQNTNNTTIWLRSPARSNPYFIHHPDHINVVDERANMVIPSQWGTSHYIRSLCPHQTRIPLISPRELLSLLLIQSPCFLPYYCHSNGGLVVVFYVSRGGSRRVITCLHLVCISIYQKPAGFPRHMFASNRCLPTIQSSWCGPWFVAPCSSPTCTNSLPSNFLKNMYFILGLQAKLKKSSWTYRAHSAL